MECVDLLEARGAVLSMSHAGCPWENGRCESFIKTLKREEIDARPYRTIEELEAHVEEFISLIYNSVRLHSALAYLSPVEFEQRQQLGKSATAWLPGKTEFSKVSGNLFRCSRPLNSPGQAPACQGDSSE